MVVLISMARDVNRKVVRGLTEDRGELFKAPIVCGLTAGPGPLRRDPREGLLSDGDRNVIVDPRSRRIVQDQGITLITWKQLVEMTRKQTAVGKQVAPAANSK